jgi:hypothetical protein
MRHFRRLAATTAMAVALTLPSFGGQAPAPPSSAATTPALVAANHFLYALGDSVLLGVQYGHTLQPRLPGWRITFNCRGSLRLAQAYPYLRARYWRPGDTVVINLGNNYIPGEGGTFASQINRAMWILRAVRRVVWVTVAEKWSSRITINRAIRAAALRYPRIRVADWAPIVRTHPWYMSDGLHLTTSGRRAMAALIAAKVLGR